MCATCGCGQKDRRHPGYGKGPSGKKAYNMSKAMRNFDAIADALLTDDFDDFEKADEPKASAGRYATGIIFPGIHGAVAGKKGKKLRASGNEVGGTIAGSAVGAGGAYGAGRALGKLKNPRAAIVAAGLGGLLGSGGGYVGAGLGVRRAQRKGQYKSQDNQA